MEYVLEAERFALRPATAGGREAVITGGPVGEVGSRTYLGQIFCLFSILSGSERHGAKPSENRQIDQQSGKDCHGAHVADRHQVLAGNECRDDNRAQTDT